MILRTPPFTVTRPDFERIASIPFAYKYENVCWVGLYKDKNTDISVTKMIIFIYIRFVAAFFISGSFFFSPLSKQVYQRTNLKRHIKFR